MISADINQRFHTVHFITAQRRVGKKLYLKPSTQNQLCTFPPSLVKKLLSILSQLTLMLFQLQHRAELLKILFANGHHKTELETGVRSLINLEVALGFTVG